MPALVLVECFSLREGVCLRDYEEIGIEAKGKRGIAAINSGDLIRGEGKEKGGMGTVLYTRERRIYFCVPSLSSLYGFEQGMMGSNQQ